MARLPHVTLKPAFKKIVLLAIGILLLGSAWNIGSRLFLPGASFEALLQHGIRAYREGAIDVALQRFREAEQAAPGNAVVHYLLAQALEAMGREEEAAGHYQKALELNPAEAAPRYNLAVIYRRRGERQAAIGELKSALKARPDFAGASLLLGGLYVEEGMHAEAALELERLLRNPGLDRPVVIAARNLLGRAYLGLEEKEKARLQYEEVLRLDFTNQEAREALDKL